MRDLGPYQPRSSDALFRGDLISGLVPSQAADTDHDITISAGAVRQERGTENYSFTSALTKQIDAAWAEGTDQGGLDGTESVPGTPDANTWYFIWLIHNATTNVNDALFSESGSAPTVPSGWTWERRIGAVRTDGSANILPFTAYETSGGAVRYVWDVTVNSENASNPGTSAVTVTLLVPGTVLSEAHIKVLLVTTTTAVNLLLTETAQTDTAPSGTSRTMAANTDARISAISTHLRTDATSLIRYRLDASTAGVTVEINTIGWLDPRLV